MQGRGCRHTNRPLWRMDVESVRLTSACAASWSLAAQANGVPLVSTLEVANDGPEPLAGLRIQVEVSGGPRWVQVLDAPLPPGAPMGCSVWLEEPPGEPGARTVEITVHHADAVVAKATHEVEVLPADEWPGDAAPPELLAAFVRPNDPVIDPLLVQVRALLGEWTGAEELDAYGARNVRRVKKTVTAVYTAVRRVALAKDGSSRRVRMQTSASA